MFLCWCTRCLLQQSSLVNIEAISLSKRRRVFNRKLSGFITRNFGVIKRHYRRYYELPKRSLKASNNDSRRSILFYVTGGIILGRIFSETAISCAKRQISFGIVTVSLNINVDEATNSGLSFLIGRRQI